MNLALRVHGGMTAAACVDQAVAADRGGFTTLWFAENPFNRGVWPALAACANPYSRHPTLIAMEIGAFDEASEGRAVLGLGSGIGSKVAQIRLGSDRPLAAMRDAFEITRGLLAGEEVRYAGGRYPARVPAPAPRNPDPHGRRG